MFVYFSTHPACQRQPARLEGLPEPQEYILRTSDGLEQRIWYYPPENGAVIIAFGAAGGSLGSSLPPVRFLIESGYGIVQIDSRACAEPRGVVTLGGKEALDAAAVLDFLRARPEVRHVGAIGFSMGGVAAVRAAARYPEIAAVVDDGGFFNLGRDMVEPDQAKPVTRNLFLYTIAGLFWLQTGVNPWEISPIDDLPSISPRPVLLIYGSRESGTGRAEAQFAAANQPKELWIVSGSRHGENHVTAPQEYERRVLEFFDQYLLDQ
jgi:pimeloyl-ACP methyl ester carboxylesterase